MTRRRGAVGNESRTDCLRLYLLRAEQQDMRKPGTTRRQRKQKSARSKQSATACAAVPRNPSARAAYQQADAARLLQTEQQALEKTRGGRAAALPKSAIRMRRFGGWSQSPASPRRAEWRLSANDGIAGSRGEQEGRCLPGQPASARVLDPPCATSLCVSNRPKPDVISALPRNRVAESAFRHRQAGDRP
jgi:hypothetical protein